MRDRDWAGRVSRGASHMSDVTAVRTLLDSDGFRVGMIVGAIGVLAVWCTRFGGRSGRGRPLRIGASVVRVVATLAGLRGHDALSLRIVLAVVLLAAGGAAMPAWWFPVRMFMLTPGAL